MVITEAISPPDNERSKDLAPWLEYPPRQAGPAPSPSRPLARTAAEGGRTIAVVIIILYNDGDGAMAQSTGAAVSRQTADVGHDDGGGGGGDEARKKDNHRTASLL